VTSDRDGQVETQYGSGPKNTEQRINEPAVADPLFAGWQDWEAVNRPTVAMRPQSEATTLEE